MMMVLLKSLWFSQIRLIFPFDLFIFDHIDTVTIVTASSIGKFLLISLGAETWHFEHYYLKFR